MRPEAVEAVVFDLDGVLVDSFAVMRKAFAAAYREVVDGSEPPFEEYARHLGRYFPDIMRLMGLPLEMEEHFVRESHRLSGEVRVYHGVPELLRTLRAAGLPLAVATGKSGVRARSLLASVGLADLLDHVVGSDETTRPKPAPDIVHSALAPFGLPASAAVMVGDAALDIRSGRAAGAATAAALWGEGDGRELLAERPDVVLARPADLLAVLELPAVPDRQNVTSG